MSISSASKATGADVQKPVVVDIQGRVDAVDANTLFGWAWNAKAPDERLRIRILIDDREIGVATADRQRIDLQRSGIGDGRHAFEFALPEGDDAVRDRLTVIAASPSTGTESVLRKPSGVEVAAEAMVAAPLRRATDLLEAMLVAQRRFQIAQQTTAETLKDAVERIDRAGTTESAIAPLIETVQASHAALEERLAQIEVFHVRFDHTLSDLDRRIGALRSSADRPLRRAVTALALVTALVAGIAIYAVALQTIGS